MRLVRNKPNDKPEFKTPPEFICNRCNKVINTFPYYYNGEPERYHANCIGDRDIDKQDIEYKYEEDDKRIPHVNFDCSGHGIFVIEDDDIILEDNE